MVRVGIFGATGYTGLELVRRLCKHPGVEIVLLTSEQYAGKQLHDVFPFAPRFDFPLVNSEEGLESSLDFAFLALPHTVSMRLVPALLDEGVKVIDLSADFRLSDPVLYEETYGVEHSSPHLLRESAYGLCEIEREKIKGARLVAVPGCFPASVIIPLYPLLKEGIVDEKIIIADSKTGVSGGGRTPKLSFHYPEVEGGIIAYGFPRHRHTSEMEDVLSRTTGSSVSVAFVPHLASMVRGILSTIYLPLKGGVDESDVAHAFARSYGEEPFVRIYGGSVFPSTKYVAGTNYCDIGFQFREDSGLLIIVSAIDNLVKGASGSAVQCLNVMLGCDERTALDDGPLFP